MRFFQPLARFASPLICLYIERGWEECHKILFGGHNIYVARKHIREEKANPSRNKNFWVDRIHEIKCKKVEIHRTKKPLSF